MSVWGHVHLSEPQAMTNEGGYKFTRCLAAKIPGFCCPFTSRESAPIHKLSHDLLSFAKWSSPCKPFTHCPTLSWLRYAWLPIKNHVLIAFPWITYPFLKHSRPKVQTLCDFNCYYVHLKHLSLSLLRRFYSTCFSDSLFLSFREREGEERETGLEGRKVGGMRGGRREEKKPLFLQER